MPLRPIAQQVWSGSTSTGSSTAYYGLGFRFLSVFITNNTTNFPTTTVGQKSLNVAHEFTAAAAGTPWGTITHIGIFDDPTAGNLWLYATLTTSQAINVGDVARIPVGTAGLNITLE